jgi:hypothetical protein
MQESCSAVEALRGNQAEDVCGSAHDSQIPEVFRMMSLGGFFAEAMDILAQIGSLSESSFRELCTSLRRNLRRE